MAMTTASFIFFFLCLASASFSSATDNTTTTQTFIVYVSKVHKPTIFSSDHHWYSSILDFLPPSPHPATILYTYSHAINGFSAHLSHHQAGALAEFPGIISVVPEQIHHLHTTHTPQFLGISPPTGRWPSGGDGDGIIIGVLDTGVWPGHPSFSDAGMSDVPENWKGTCETSSDFLEGNCNKKLIGARSFSAGFIEYLRKKGEDVDPQKDSLSPKDDNGHGTHTATTAAGSSVEDASFYSYAKGEARGIAKKAQIAAYKVCWSAGCFDSDILKGMEQAIEDGVHVISMSIGSKKSRDYYADNKAIGAFGATKHGIIVVGAAGNAGPKTHTVTNVAPWILVVGASTIDREFKADAVLGDGTVLSGASLYTGQPLPEKQFPLVYADSAGDRFCQNGSLLDDSKVKDKIVVCDGGMISPVKKGKEVARAGGVGMIVLHVKQDLKAYPYLTPATLVGLNDKDKILRYIRSSQSPTATITFNEKEVIGNSPPSPKVAAFSSRGPNNVTLEILKPDVVAPGVNILAGWSGAVSASGLDDDSRRVQFNIVSGTSMACPHVSGIAAVLKKAHPDWSPAAIKSALITTAYNEDNSGQTIADTSTGAASTPFERGAGHVHPNAALDPGLIYDIDTDGYVSFLCAIGYDSGDISKFNGTLPPSDFCGKYNPGNPGNINYPSFSVVFKRSSLAVTYKRTVKNVGENPDAVYNVKINAPPNVDVTVAPEALAFSLEKSILSYEITFSTTVSSASSSSFGSIEWSDGTHRVRSPIAVTWKRASPSVASI